MFAAQVYKVRLEDPGTTCAKKFINKRCLHVLESLSLYEKREAIAYLCRCIYLYISPFYCSYFILYIFYFCFDDGILYSETLQVNY